MAIIKCKMCGGDLELVAGSTVAECEYCGTRQTVPTADNEKKLTLFARANRLRAACDFDKAAGIYESIVADFPEEAEAYWGLVLCKYGIEYVDDPATGKKIPTCHRSGFDSVLEDTNYEQAMENADMMAQGVYRDEAKQLEQLRKDIISVSSGEKPYDIFICYKETDAAGGRTLDSVLAQDLYTALTDKGYRVFFSRITLQGKLGQAYEPYIFAALHSAKVMLAVGTRYEYYTAVWVKNEWSRYLKLMAQDKGKHLIPCYKDLDPEDMPKEFSHLQGADLGKMGAVQDILFNMEKYIPLQKETVVVRQPEVSNTAPLLKRAFMFLEDGEWSRADEFCEQVLNLDPECAQAYLCKLLAELKVRKQEALRDYVQPFDDCANYQKAIRFGDMALQTALTSYIEYIKTHNENARLLATYTHACELLKQAKINTVNRHSNYQKAAELFASIRDYKDAEALEKDALKSGEIAREEAKKKAKRYKTIATITCGTVVVALAIIIWCTVLAPMIQYNDAVALMEQGEYAEAIAAFEAMAGYSDSTDKIAECQTAILDGKYDAAVALMESGQYVEAIAAFKAINGYSDSANKITECKNATKYDEAIALMYSQKYADAKAAFDKLGEYKDAEEKAMECVKKQSYTTGEILADYKSFIGKWIYVEGWVSVYSYIEAAPSASWFVIFDDKSDIPHKEDAAKSKFNGLITIDEELNEEYKNIIVNTTSSSAIKSIKTSIKTRDHVIVYGKFRESEFGGLFIDGSEIFEIE